MALQLVQFWSFLSWNLYDIYQFLWISRNMYRCRTPAESDVGDDYDDEGNVEDGEIGNHLKMIQVGNSPRRVVTQLSKTS